MNIMFVTVNTSSAICQILIHHRIDQGPNSHPKSSSQPDRGQYYSHSVNVAALAPIQPIRAQMAVF